MKYRALLCEDNEFVREVIKFVLDERNYEVFLFEDAADCPLHSTTECFCNTENLCADIIISDVSMPKVSGLEFVEKLKEIGCKIKHIALVSGYWTEQDISRANEIGSTVFHKPLHPEVLSEWLDECEKNIDPQRILSNF
jgi:CheY-like chemotaxis protein